MAYDSAEQDVQNTLEVGKKMTEQQVTERSRLLNYYQALGSTDLSALENTALRCDSLHMREILAHAASLGRLSGEELERQVLDGIISATDLDLEPAVRLARLVGLQNTLKDDTEFATKLLELVLPHVDVQSRAGYHFHRMLAELYFEQRNVAALEPFLREHRGVRGYFHGYIPADANNPFVRANFVRGDHDSRRHKKWLTGFNRQFTHNKLIPVDLRKGSEKPFNRLVTLPVHGPQRTGPKVTVILTAYQPVREDILQSARSILAQTWGNLELLVVDDASPEEYQGVLDELAALDERVQVIRLRANGGTYQARNEGIAQSTGDFITGQDADDWSHPQRLETQVNYLLRHPRCPGNQVNTVNMGENLVRIRRGYMPFIPSAPTLMVRSHIMRELGGFLPARKAADNEMRGRVSAYVGERVAVIHKPLIFMRILPDSLSRADFRAGWQHPARRAFWSAYKTWHATAAPEELRRTADEGFPIHVPPRFTAAPGEQVRTDVVFAADWCEEGETQVNALAEIRALLVAGLRVGVMHLENAQHLSRRARTYCRPVQELISAGEVRHLIQDEDFHDVRLMVVRNPELLQFMPRGRAAFSVEALAVVAEGSPAKATGPVTFLSEDCARHGEDFFGRRATWIAASVEVRDLLRQRLGLGSVVEELYRWPFDPEPFRVRRSTVRNIRPVVGRWAGDLPEHWPADTSLISSIWPTDGTVDVRLYGDSGVVRRHLRTGRLPAAWMSFQPGEITRRTYYRSLDFFVHYPHVQAYSAERSILESLAAGCVTILPPGYEGIYGDAALYCEAGYVKETISKYAADLDLFLGQSRRGTHFEGFRGEEDYVQTIRELLNSRQDQLRETMAR